MTDFFCYGYRFSENVVKTMQDNSYSPGHGRKEGGREGFGGKKEGRKRERKKEGKTGDL